MQKREARERIEHLKKVINHHRYLYAVLDRSEISDSALDSLKKELFDLETEFPELVTPDSPTQRVAGKPLKEFAKVRHAERMTSFNDAFSEEDMRAWLKRLEDYIDKSVSDFYCELKIDGLAIELEYDGSVFVRGSTRGDGLIGEDVTQNLRTIEAIPLRILPEDEVKQNLKKLGLTPGKYNIRAALQGHLIVRGEVFLTKKDFARINKELEKKE